MVEEQWTAFENLSDKVEQLDMAFVLWLNQQEAIGSKFSEEDMRPAIDLYQGKYFFEPFMDEPSDDFEPPLASLKIYLASYMYGKFGREERRKAQQAFLATLSEEELVAFEGTEANGPVRVDVFQEARRKERQQAALEDKKEHWEFNADLWSKDSEPSSPPSSCQPTIEETFKKMSPEEQQQTLSLLSWLSKQIGKKDVGVQCEEMPVESVVRGSVSLELGWELLASNPQGELPISLWFGKAGYTLEPEGHPVADDVQDDIDGVIFKNGEKPREASFGRASPGCSSPVPRRSSKPWFCRRAQRLCCASTAPPSFFCTRAASSG